MEVASTEVVEAFIKDCVEVASVEAFVQASVEVASVEVSPWHGNVEASMEGSMLS